MKKRYENKTFYDPGRFRFRLTFYEEITQGDGSGGSQPLTAPVYVCQAVQEQIKISDQLAIQAGASVLTQDCYFIIRYNADFPIVKNYLVGDGYSFYTIAGIITLDFPINYVKILCKIKR